MLALSFEMLAGRYHATGWDHHVNEGTIEWPPSPWRILRALVAASYKANIAPEVAWPLIRRLSGLPVYALPAASQAHLRHYMPIPGTTTLVFDAFAVTEGGAAKPAKLVAAWPDVELTAEERTLLARLCAHVGYLGRSESWTEATVLDHWDGHANAMPTEPSTNEAASVTLPSLQPEPEYAAWRQGFLDAQTAKKKRTPPADLWEVLHADTAVMQKEGWSQPPGTRQVRYSLLERPYHVARVARASKGRTFTVARFRVTSNVPPAVQHAISIGERMRQAVLAHSDAVLGRQLGVFTGKTDAGEALRGNEHAFWLPEDRDGDGRIDHLVAYAASGFDAEATRVLRNLRRLWGAEGHELDLVLIETGEPSDLGTTSADNAPARTPLLGCAREWLSRTPFVPPRHLKRGDYPEDQVKNLLVAAGLPVPTQIEAIDAAYDSEPHASHKPIRWLEFRRERSRGGGSRGSDRGFGFRLTFEQPVDGPIVLGYGAHFGLGQFVALR